MGRWMRFGTDEDRGAVEGTGRRWVGELARTSACQCARSWRLADLRTTRRHDCTYSPLEHPADPLPSSRSVVFKFFSLRKVLRADFALHSPTNTPPNSKWDAPRRPSSSTCELAPVRAPYLRAAR